MRNTIFLLFYILAFNSASAQITSDSNTIILECTGNKNTTLIFSNPIKNAIVGSDNFMFAFNKDNYGKIGILKGSPGEESNLLVITENGNIFSFTVRYKKDISKTNYFIDDIYVIGNENSKAVNQKGKNKVVSESDGTTNVKEVTVNDYQSDNSVPSDSISNYKASCLDEINKPSFYKRIYGSKNKITIKLKNISYINDELFFSIVLSNESTLDYDINFLNYYITSRNKKKTTTTQTIPYTAKYIHNNPTKIKSGEVLDVVYVYTKFTINENKILLLEMSEDNGERTVRLEIPNTFINNPNI